MKIFSRALGFAVIAAAGFAGGVAFAHPQPTMEAALRALQNARGQLEHAAQDKGGWRVKAISDTQAAIQDVEMGIQFANREAGG